MALLLLILAMLGSWARPAGAEPQNVTKLVIEPEPEIPPPSPGTAPALTLQESLRNAYLRNPTLRAARAQLKATQERLPQALAGWQPTILSTAGAEVTDIDGSSFGGEGSTAKDVGVSLAQPLYRGGRTSAETAAARAVIAAQEMAVRAIEQDILQRTATAYMDVLRDQSLLELSENNREFIAQETEATQDRFDVGELTRTDVSQAQARLARADSNIITARGALNSSRAAFEEVTGVPPEHLVAPDYTLKIPESLDEAVIEADTNSPDILSAVFAHKASEDDVDGVFGELLPEVGLSASWDRAYDPSPGLTDEQTTSAVGIRATIPLYKAGAVRSRVRQAKHTSNQRYIEILEARRAIKNAVSSQWADLRTAEAEIRSREAEVEAALVAQEGVKAETELGARTVLDVLDANQELLDARAALVTAQRNEVVARFRLLSTLGALSPEKLGFGGDTYKYGQNLADMRGNIFNMDVDSVQESD